MLVWQSISTVLGPVSYCWGCGCPSDTIPWCSPTTHYSVFLCLSVHPWSQTPHTSPADCPPFCRYAQTGSVSSPWWVVQCSLCCQLVFWLPRLWFFSASECIEFFCSTSFQMPSVNLCPTYILFQKIIITQLLTCIANFTISPLVTYCPSQILKVTAIMKLVIADEY